jgi:hypothetical protein
MMLWKFSVILNFQISSWTFVAGVAVRPMTGTSQLFNYIFRFLYSAWNHGPILTMSLIYGYKEIVIFKKIDIFLFVNDSGAT